MATIIWGDPLGLLWALSSGQGLLPVKLWDLNPSSAVLGFESVLGANTHLVISPQAPMVGTTRLLRGPHPQNWR